MNSEAPDHNKDHSIEISVQCPDWEEIEGIEQIVTNTVMTALKQAILPNIAQNRPLEVSVVLANNDLVQVLNREYREKDKPTNVLTFATLDGDEPIVTTELNLGDIILAYETIALEAKEQKKFKKDHIKHLLVHGTLHLLGYDHQTEEEATDMETLEIRILQSLGVENPYTDYHYGV